MRTVQIENVGPIQTLSIPIPEEGGIVILCGKNGSGKTQALDATQALISGSGSLSVRDRQKSGEVDGFGATIRVGRSTRRTGELECLSLEGKLSIAELVDPGMKSPEAADARRIKSLIALTGAVADPALFYELLDDPAYFERIVAPSSLAQSDLVEMAARVKRDLEAAARKAEDEAEHLGGHVKGLLESVQGLDLLQESDAVALQAELEKAVENNSALKKAFETSARIAAGKERARAALAQAQSSYAGPSSRETGAEFQAAMERKSAAIQDEIRAKNAWDKAKQHLREAEKAEETARSANDAALSHEATLRSWQAQIEASSGIEPVMPEQLNQAANAVTVARETVEIGAKIRDAIKRQADAEATKRKAKERQNEALRLREAAKSTDEIISNAVASPILRVEGGRLVLDTERGVTFFSELSMGERWKIAVDIAADQVGSGGIIVINQEAYESLDPDNREAIAEHARARRVVILTAEATEGTLRAEMY